MNEGAYLAGKVQRLRASARHRLEQNRFHDILRGTRPHGECGQLRAIVVSCGVTSMNYDSKRQVGPLPLSTFTNSRRITKAGRRLSFEQPGESAVCLKAKSK